MLNGQTWVLFLDEGHLRVLAEPDQILDRFASSPEKSSCSLVSKCGSTSIFRHLYKLGEVEWDFVEAQRKNMEKLGFIKLSAQSMYVLAPYLTS